jgi:riboflavin biosynthesis pyrimidine reductase
VITSATAPATSVDSLRDVADIVIAGNEGVDLRAALQQLRAQNLQTLLCEGGPTLNNQLLADDLVDEWCQTIAPLLTGGDATRGAYGPTTGVKRTLQLSRIIVDDDVLLLRYARES